MDQMCRKQDPWPTKQEFGDMHNYLVKGGDGAVNDLLTAIVQGQ